MKKIYMQPTIMVTMFSPCAILASSYGEGVEVTEIDDTPGDGEDYG